MDLEDVKLRMREVWDELMKLVREPEPKVNWKKEGF